MVTTPCSLIGISLISQDRQLQEDLGEVIKHINGWLSGGGVSGPTLLPGPFKALLMQAQQYLNAHGARDPYQLVLRHFTSLDETRMGLHQGRLTTECLFLDSRGMQLDEAHDPFAKLLAIRSDARLSPSSAILFCEEERLAAWMRLLGGNRLIRMPHAQQGQRRADLLRLLLDHLEHAHFNRLLVRTTYPQAGPITLAQALCGLMRTRWKEHWDFHFFTGSMVAGFIDSMQALTKGTDVGFYSGCNEHALAVSAMAGWQLHGRAYVIAVTSGMLDEARGTLDNLRRAGAPGIVVCAESPESVWFAFQGTLDADRNGHDVVAARGLWHGFLREPRELQECLSNAFSALDRRPAPTFVFATQAALESRSPLPDDFVQNVPVMAPDRRVEQTRQRDHLKQAVAIMNSESAPILWQCGRLTDTQRDRIILLARKTGIALADSIVAPGSIPAWHKGVSVRNYLGPLSMYGFTRRIYEFLEHGCQARQQQESLQAVANGDVLASRHASGNQARHRPSPWLFFLKGKVDQSATPYSEGRLQRNFRIAQVNRNPAHIAPFCTLPLEMTLDDFLDYVEPRVAPDPGVLAYRQAHLDQLQSAAETMPSDCIETLPMTPNYFFMRLGRLVADLIGDEGYCYTGVYDVGRCSLSALRNIPRTGPGFSGWYGRALMGDGLMALPYLAIRNPHNLLAFIGDGARALVPDIEQRLALCAASSPYAARRNISVFYLNNGVLSMIQTYLDKRYALNGNRQVNVPRPGERNVLHTLDSGHRLNCQTIKSFCPETLRAALMAPGRINFFDVMLGHNSDGDGLSLVSEETWSRQPVEGRP